MKILLAIDNSDCSRTAIKRLATQFRPEETEIRVLHVVELPSVSAPPQMDARYVPELNGQVKEGETLVGSAAEELRAAGFQVSTLVEKGDTRSVIVDEAAEWHCDLIVLGSHGRKGLGRFLLGSVSEAVARHAPCSVEIVRVSPRP